MAALANLQVQVSRIQSNVTQVLDKLSNPPVIVGVPEGDVQAQADALAAQNDRLEIVLNPQVVG